MMANRLLILPKKEAYQIILLLALWKTDPAICGLALMAAGPVSMMASRSLILRNRRDYPVISFGVS